VRANELLEAEGRLPIAHLTPHTLRRTLASILASCNVPPRRAMYLLGHTDPKFTFAAYQQVLDMGTGSVEALEPALGTTLDHAREVLHGRGQVQGSRNEFVIRADGAASSPEAHVAENAKTPPERGFRRSG
jgi:hypothetical protein